jgi:hypothetical protein
MAASSEKTDDNIEKSQLDTKTPGPAAQDPAPQDVKGSKEDTVERDSTEDRKSHSSIAPESDGHETEGEEHEPSNTGTPVRPQSSRASSIFSRSPAIVPRSQRRGLFGRFAIIPEIERAQDYTNKTKWMITAIIALAAAAAPIGAGIFYRKSHCHEQTIDWC